MGYSWCALAAFVAVACGVDAEGAAAIGDTAAGSAGENDVAVDASSGDAGPVDDTGSTSDGGSADDTSDGGSIDDTGSTSASGDAGSTTTVPDAVPRVRVAAGETHEAELVERLPVGKSEGAAKRRIVLRLSPDELPDLQVGDRLIAAAEVQLTTRCDVGQNAPGCGYDPKIRGQLILTGDQHDDDAAGPESRALSSAQTQTCTKNEHHCMFVFRPADATKTIEGLPCVANGDCRVNLVMWAWDGDARPDGQDEVIVGANEGNYLDNGIVDPDKARLMAVREREIAAGDRHERETTGGGTRNVPTNAQPVLVYSHALEGGDLIDGEQFVVEAKVVASVGGRARFGAKLFLTKDPDATDGGGPNAIAPEQINEHNGVNCVASHRCTTRKVAVFRVTDDIAGPVYVNLVVESAVPGGGSTSVTVHREDGWLRSTRYEAEHEG